MSHRIVTQSYNSAILLRYWLVDTGVEEEEEEEELMILRCRQLIQLT